MWLQGGNKEDSVCVFLFSGFNKHQTPGFAALALTDSVCVCEAKLRGAEAAAQAALQQDVHSFGHLCLGVQALVSALPDGCCWASPRVPP